MKTTTYFLALLFAATQMWALNVYWTDRTNGLVIQSDENGSSPSTIVSGLVGPRQLAYDTVNFKIYLNDTTSIKRFNVDGSGQETLVTGLNNGYGVDVVPGTGTFYYSDTSGGGTGTIYSHPISGGSSTSVVSEGSRTYHDLSVDTVNSRIFFASESAGFDAIRQVNTNGTGLSTYFGSMQAARGTDVDSDNGHLYYTGSSSFEGRLKRGNVGGGGETVLVTTSTSDPPEGVSVNVANDYIFYTRDGNNTINRSSLTGTGVTQIGSVAGDTHGVLAIPEPSTWGLIIGGGALSLVLMQRALSRRRREKLAA